PDTYITNLTFRLLRDDGAVVYLNGREMYRSNMPNGSILYTTLASVAVNGADEATYFATTIPTNIFPGTNLLAVEVHQNATTSSDVSFDLELSGSGYVANTSVPALAATQSGNQLQIAWPSSATGYQLYSSPEVGPGAAWQLVTGTFST